jgi:hypothetical protein
MPAALVMRIVVGVAVSAIWASTGRAGEIIVEAVTPILLPGLLAITRLLVELAVIGAAGWMVVLSVRRARRCRRGGDDDSP